jgi:glucose/arabinose dehydrogenase
MHRENASGMVRAVACGAVFVWGILALPRSIGAQALVDPTLNVSTVVSGLDQPIAMAFIGRDDILVTEKASGQVKRVTAGVVTGVVLDLPVNSSSERGLLGIALHPRFPRVPYVYLYNTESTTGADSNVLAEVPCSAIAWTASGGTAAP